MALFLRGVFRTPRPAEQSLSSRSAPWAPRPPGTRTQPAPWASSICAMVHAASKLDEQQTAEPRGPARQPRSEPGHVAVQL